MGNHITTENSRHHILEKWIREDIQLLKHTKCVIYYIENQKEMEGYEGILIIKEVSKLTSEDLPALREIEEHYKIKIKVGKFYLNIEGIDDSF